jgi:hypothetical protein
MADWLLNALLERSRYEAATGRRRVDARRAGQDGARVGPGEAELTAHSGYERNERTGRGGSPNHCNGSICAEEAQDNIQNIYAFEAACSL